MQHCVLLVLLFVGGFAFPAFEDERVGDDMNNFFDHTGVNIDGRIVGGSTAAEGSYPWMAAITTGLITHMFLCGGAIISNRHVLTAGHCIDAILLSEHILDTLVVVGTNRWQDGRNLYGLRFLSRNPDYDAVTKKNDLGIFVTSSDIIFNNRVTPVEISYGFVHGGFLVRVSGWGWSRPGGTLSDELQEIRLITIDGASCVQEVRRVAQSLGMHVPLVDPDLEICTFLTGNEGICIGDGGSPLVLRSSNIDFLIGVASWGVPCARGAPDVFTRVSGHMGWIQYVMNVPV